MTIAALPDPSLIGDILFAFLSLLFASVPYLLIGALLSGLISVFLPEKLLPRLFSGNRVISTLLAGFIGVFLPVAKCALIPVTRRLVQKGLPASCAITFLLAAPIFNPVTAWSTFTAFSKAQENAETAGMAIARLSFGLLIAVVIGLLFTLFKPSQVLQPTLANSARNPEAGDARPTSFGGKLVKALRASMSDFLDTAMYFTIGALLVAIFNTQMNAATLAKVAELAKQEHIGIPLLMGAGFILSLCSTADAFIANSVILFTAPAKLAFLVLSPMMDVKLLFLYSTVFKRRITLGLLIILVAVVGYFSAPWLHFIQSRL